MPYKRLLISTLPNPFMKTHIIKPLIISIGISTLSFSMLAQISKPLTKKGHIKKKETPAPVKKEAERSDNFAVTETQEIRYNGSDEELANYFRQEINFNDSSI